jgi:hypothetical protein
MTSVFKPKVPDTSAQMAELEKQRKEATAATDAKKKRINEAAGALRQNRGRSLVSQVLGSKETIG